MNRRDTLLALIALGAALLVPALVFDGARAQTPPMVEQRSCDLRAKHGYCIGMTALTPGVEALVSSCAPNGGALIGVCPDNDTIAWCALPVPHASHMHVYHFSGRDPRRWTVARARAECTRRGGALHVPPG